ncbi:MAG TPA: EamA family transporter [Paenibacillaceae bacterium]|nr:EamA family transporter [Paenibacillaceae bacterium]
MIIFWQIAFITLIWGYTWVVMKIGLDYFPPFLFSTLRLMLGGFLLLVVLRFFKIPWKPEKKDLKPLFIMGLLMSTGYFGLLTFGMQFVSSGETAVLVYLMPILVSLLAHYLLGERLTLIKGIGLISGLIGLLFVIGPQAFTYKNSETLLGQVLILLSALVWAFANIYSKKQFTNYNKEKMTAWQMIMGSTLLLILSLFTEDFSIVQWNGSGILTLLFTGILSSAAAFAIWFRVLDKIEASTASMALMLVPFFGLVFGWLQLGETFTLYQLIGSTLIFLGIFLVSFQKYATSQMKYEHTPKRIN